MENNRGSERTLMEEIKDGYRMDGRGCTGEEKWNNVKRKSICISCLSDLNVAISSILII